jgi:hypothetical protein
MRAEFLDFNEVSNSYANLLNVGLPLTNRELQTYHFALLSSKPYGGKIERLGTRCRQNSSGPIRDQQSDRFTSVVEIP